MSSSKESTRDQRTLESVQAQFKETVSQLGGGSLCSAKWLQTTLHVFNGTTQSCHHCPSYKVDPVNVKSDPSLLHNIEVKVEQRKGMRVGEKPSDCNYCWRAEGLGAVSDRMTKTINPEWSLPALDRLKEDRPFPSYLEVAFDSTCNLACAYCGPINSSKWVEDIKRYGEYPSNKERSLSELERLGLLPIPQSQPNPYRDAFWQWWPELYKHLHVFRITGGEPLLSKSTWRVLDFIQSQPRSDLILGINTNLSVEPSFISRLIQFSQATEFGLRKLQIYTSCEAEGEQAEYIRDGLNYTNWLTNIQTLLSQTERTTVTIMMTLNALSLFSLDRFLMDIYAISDQYPNRIALDFAYLRHPSFMDVRVMERGLRVAYLDRVKALVSERGIPLHHSLFDRFYKHALEELPLAERLRLLEAFYTYFEAYDKRRGKSLYSTFPELL